MDINWNLLGRAPDYGALFRKGFAEGRDTGRQYRQENALAALASNPDDEGAMSELAGINPEAAWKVQDRRTAAAKTERDLVLAQIKERERDIMEGAQIIRQINPQGPEDWNRVLGAAQARGVNLEGVPRTWDEQTKTYAQQLVDLANTFEPPKSVDRPSSVQEYEYAKGQGFAGTYVDWKAQNQGPIVANNGDGTFTLIPRSGVGGSSPAPTPGGDDIPTASTPEEVEALPPGARFKAPDGSIRTKPGGPTQPASGRFLGPY